jgi:Cysteine-rich CPXCG
MKARFATVTCPSCFQEFEVAAPPREELPAELDYDCEICCRPMVIVIVDDDGEIRAESKGISD